MANLVVHFEIHAAEPQALIDFYGGLLGRRFDRFGDLDYWAISTGRGFDLAGRPRVGHQRRPDQTSRPQPPAGRSGGGSEPRTLLNKAPF